MPFVQGALIHSLVDPPGWGLRTAGLRAPRTGGTSLRAALVDQSGREVGPTLAIVMDGVETAVSADTVMRFAASLAVGLTALGRESSGEGSDCVGSHRLINPRIAVLADRSPRRP